MAFEAKIKLKDPNRQAVFLGSDKTWNVEERHCIGVLTGHTGSVKSVCAHPSKPDLVVSGPRDGSFAQWDLRCKGETSSTATSVVKVAHTLVQGKRVRHSKLPNGFGCALGVIR